MKKTEGRKSRDTVPLKGMYGMRRFPEYWSGTGRANFPGPVPGPYPNFELCQFWDKILS
jgi:hypothetical protein